MAKNELGPMPVHVGVIMDGNGRWAKKRGLPRKFGHREGAKTFRKIVRHAKAIGIKYITFYAFSTENWKRPDDEVQSIMKLFEKYLDELDDFLKEHVRIRFIGDRSMLTETLQAKMKRSEELSKDYDLMTLILAINYGGRDEITNAVKLIAEDVKAGNIEPSEIDENLIQSRLYTAEIPDVDLIIRPSGEQRLSNFLIWQSAYAEYYFTDILWPDFSKKDLEKAVEVYRDRHRRFGGV
ncbi:undecaprenyl diphosphate synthase [Ruminococcaceae bacterium FB2012]|nr:undecaprenyl diphosphate synthase [Ruminococcaceae bacterium FB2012]